MTIQTERKLGKRSVAAIIDYTIFASFLFWFLTNYGVPDGEGGYSVSGIKGLWVEVVWFIYFPLVESFTGQTLGKLLIGLRVVTENGNPISFWQSIKRRLLDMVDFTFFGIVALVTVSNTPRHQRVGDLWAKTLVIGGDSFRCRNCYQEATLSNEEIIKGEFECPFCHAANKTQVI